MSASLHCAGFLMWAACGFAMVSCSQVQVVERVEAVESAESAEAAEREAVRPGVDLTAMSERLVGGYFMGLVPDAALYLMLDADGLCWVSEARHEEPYSRDSPRGTGTWSFDDEFVHLHWDESSPAMREFDREFKVWATSDGVCLAPSEVRPINKHTGGIDYRAYVQGEWGNRYSFVSDLQALYGFQVEQPTILVSYTPTQPRAPAGPLRASDLGWIVVGSTTWSDMRERLSWHEDDFSRTDNSGFVMTCWTSPKYFYGDEAAQAGADAIDRNVHAVQIHFDSDRVVTGWEPVTSAD